MSSSGGQVQTNGHHQGLRAAGFPNIRVDVRKPVTRFLDTFKQAGEDYLAHEGESVVVHLSPHFHDLGETLDDEEDSLHAGRRADVRRRHAGFRILESLHGLVKSKKGERISSSQPGRIYALSSGMMTEKTVSNEFAYHFINRPENAVCFVGYADPDSPAGQILSSAPGALIPLDSVFPPVPLNCEVGQFDFSGHAPRNELIDYARRLNPRKILLVHGDAPALDWMVKALSLALPECEVIIPMPGEKIVLSR